MFFFVLSDPTRPGFYGITELSRIAAAGKPARNARLYLLDRFDDVGRKGLAVFIY